MSTTTTKTTDITYTGRHNKLGDELCVSRAWSDWGELGWMVCEEVRAPGRPVFRTPKVFFRDDQRAEALDCALTGPFWGYEAA